MVEHKILKVDDKVCEGCPQNWEAVCRAYSMPHSEEEREFRTQGKIRMLCLPTHRY